MSAAVLKSKFVRPSSVCVAIISMPYYAEVFLSNLLLLRLLEFLKRQIFQLYEYVSLLIIWDPVGAKKKTKDLLLLQVSAERFQTSPEFSLEKPKTSIIWKTSDLGAK